tara:strand:+ start:376 stop:639 length:264 start_codon:yes stop_codon:yes gene_type:complete
LSRKFFKGRRIRRRGELLRQSNRNLTNDDEKYTLIHIKDDTSTLTNLGVYTSLQEAKEALQQSVVEAGMLHIFTENSRVLYSEKREA